jgi:glyoxylase-like metal-dependent hydrolase (beta-lactamase superfamily II)
LDLPMELPDGIRRITTPLPTRPGHVHSYLLPGEDGAMLVDTGIGLPNAQEVWSESLDGAEVARIFVTHFHPDHVGAAADVAALTRAPVYQGALDYAQCELVWDNPNWPERIADWFRTHGVPEEITEELIGSGNVYRPFIRFQRDPILVDDGDRLDGWELVAAPGHADGQLCLLKGRVLVSADHLLGRISPTVGLWPASRPDPLGDFLESLERTIELAPELALPGHGDPIADPVGRARELIEHHRERLAFAEATLTDRPRTGYEVSLDLFGADLKPAARRFAVAETLSHLERLVLEERAERREDVGIVAYTARQLGRAL